VTDKAIMLENNEPKGKNRDVIITTIGLTIHSSADGAALGASIYLD